MQDFIVIDTEGHDELSEIAVIDRQGRLIYEAFNQAHPSHYRARLNVKPLQAILLDFFRLADTKLIVCHSANHDIQVLQRSCRRAGLGWQHSLRFACSYELAQSYFPNLPSYSLEYLSKKLNLKVKQKPFNPQQAHSARYDAEFTYQLYWKIMELHLSQSQKNQSNPFSSSRVDNPFQDHPDLKHIYQDEFELLKSTIADIRFDQNHQSKGAVVIGEPGSGKTHLMMRLAKELLRVNRLLFIRQPNNPDAVLYHIYSRILESFVEKVPDNGYTQLENLLAHSFVKLISTTKHITLNRNDQAILAVVHEDPLNLYTLGADRTEKKRLLWQHIERRTNEWWMSEYGLAGYSAQIIKGIIKFCSYTEPRRKELVTRWLSAHELTQDELELIGLQNWSEDLSKEEFSLEAISVFSKLSLLDEPLIIVFDQLEGLGLKHNQQLLLNFGEAVKELFTHVPNSLIILNLFPDRWQQFQAFFDGAVIDRISQNKIYLERPTDQEIREILQLKARLVDANLGELFTPVELEAILNQGSIRAVLNAASDYYRRRLTPAPNTLPSPDRSIDQRLDRLELEFSKFQQLFREIAKAFSTVYSEEGKPEEATSTPAESKKSTEILDYLQEQRKQLAQDYHRLQIIADSDDIGKLLTIAEAFKRIQEFEIDYLRLGKKKLPEHLVFQAKNSIAVGFLQIDGSAFTGRLKNWNELIVNYKETQFFLYRDVRQAPITGKIGQEEIEKLNHSSHGRFLLLEKDDRINFELIYKLIIDIQNRDLEVELEAALETAFSELSDHWLVQILQRLQCS